MKKNAIKILTTVLLLVLHSCTNEDNPLIPESNTDITAEKNNVKTFEVINLISKKELLDKYEGKIGKTSIELLKTSDSTLTFFIPDIPAGQTELNFELATIKFNVTKTSEINEQQFINEFNTNLDNSIKILKESMPHESNEITNLINYKNDVSSLFNNLSEDEKRKTILFYEANKEIFKSYINNSFSQVGHPNTLRLTTDCSTEDVRYLYGCVANELGRSARGLIRPLWKFTEMLFLAGASAILAPASLGLSAFSTTLALGMAAHILFTELGPAAIKFGSSSLTFLKVNWIFSKAIFETVVEEFQDQVSTSLNLKPKFRSLQATDTDITPGSTYFIDALNSLREPWSKVSSVWGELPSYSNTEESTTLETNEIVISNISNPNVQYLGNDGQSVKFKSLSGKEEAFSYRIRVMKGGFIEEKTLNAKLIEKKLNYGLEIGDYHPDFSKINAVKTLYSGEWFSTPNNVQRMLRLTLDGIPISDWTQVKFGQSPTSATDKEISNYEVKFYDNINLKPVTIPLNVILTNKAYSIITNNSFTVKYYRHNELLNTQIVTFYENGTYIKKSPDGSYSQTGTYWYSTVISPSWVNCESYTIREEVEGAIELSGLDYSMPQFFIINKDNSIVANSFYGCNDRWERWDINQN